MIMEYRTRVSSYFGLVIWIYLHLRVDIHSGVRTQYLSLQTPLAIEYRTRVSPYFGLIIWIYLHLRVDAHIGVRTQYLSLQTPSRYPLSY
ncbi:unnamed protein product [Schistosoma margrebowiei]|uniref:Uncharacterized protein n=1 Tax=Schistosoma margrebowiei TaxID=48269 RepID=A0A3P7W8M4_9TREM|nr:unnamed protein product [Schistosoma margrebowiei]